MKTIKFLIAFAIALTAVDSQAQTPAELNARLNKQRGQIQQAVGLIIDLQNRVKTLEAGGTGVTIADVDERIRLRAVELKHVRPYGYAAQREEEEADFRKELKAELNDLGDRTDSIEYAIAAREKGDRNDEIKRIRRRRGW